MKGKTFETKKVYIILSLITLVSATLALLISNGKLFQVLFFIDPDDTGMDFFHSLIETHTRKPYTQYGVIYPPLANLFFYLLQLFVPDSLKADWPATHDDSKLIVGTGEDVRLMQSTMVLFLMFLILTLFVISVMIHSCTKSYLLTFCLVFSAGTFQAVERGNLILLAFVLIFYFIKHYEDERRLTRELALIALACAFGLKLFPAAFGILLLKKGHFAAAGRAILYAILVTLLPLFFFEGFDGISAWMKTLFDFRTVDNATSSGTSVMSVLSAVILVLCVGILLYHMFFAKEHRKLFRSQYLMLVTFLALQITDGCSSYNLILFIIPFLFFLEEVPRLDKISCIEFIVYCIALLPVGINQITPVFMAFFLLGAFLRIKDQNREMLQDGISTV
ncbi:MAG: DUF2029 domain-containing protein [Eubacterium sp.]|nr:DUF2029 domain-containing protein [Eubacterium sp.]